ncbi:hypothetical protein C8T65DRAFT_734216 [Cerioporus squamosus]|nr:hypothetical protein C8T65DRAFT_734216 [Cerioporus squamosus]
MSTGTSQSQTPFTGTSTSPLSSDITPTTTSASPQTSASATPTTSSQDSPSSTHLPLPQLRRIPSALYDSDFCRHFHAGVFRSSFDHHVVPYDVAVDGRCDVGVYVVYNDNRSADYHDHLFLFYHDHIVHYLVNYYDVLVYDNDHSADNNDLI